MKRTNLKSNRSDNEPVEMKDFSVHGAALSFDFGQVGHLAGHSQNSGKWLKCESWRHFGLWDGVEQLIDSLVAAIVAS